MKNNQSAMNNKQTKRIQMQKMNANKFSKGQQPGVPTTANSNYQPQSGVMQIDSNSEKARSNTSSGIPENQTISSGYKTNLEQPMTRAQQKHRTESRKDMRAISVGGADYMASSVALDEESSEGGHTAGRRYFSINITEEALRLGKLPTEQVACNIA